MHLSGYYAWTVCSLPHTDRPWSVASIVCGSALLVLLAAIGGHRLGVLRRRLYQVRCAKERLEFDFAMAERERATQGMLPRDVSCVDSRTLLWDSVADYYPPAALVGCTPLVAPPASSRDAPPGRPSTGGMGAGHMDALAVSVSAVADGAAPHGQGCETQGVGPALRAPSLTPEPLSGAASSTRGSSDALGEVEGRPGSDARSETSSRGEYEAHSWLSAAVWRRLDATLDALPSSLVIPDCEVGDREQSPLRHASASTRARQALPALVAPWSARAGPSGGHTARICAPSCSSGTSDGGNEIAAILRSGQSCL